jgi:hypothetical protein
MKSTVLRAVLFAAVTLSVISATVAWQAAPPAPAFPDALVPALQNARPRYWKGNLHTHSFWSDGDDYPEMIADWYKRHGYHFLALSDHNVLAEGERWIDLDPAKPVRALATAKYRKRFSEFWVEQRERDGKTQVRLKPLAEYRSLLEEPARFALLPAEEITHRYAKAPVHINAINLRDAIKPVDGANIAETIMVNHRVVAEQSRRTGWRTVAFLNHPNYGWAIRAEDMVATEELRFFEVFNGHPSVRNYGDELHPSCERLWDIVLALRLGKARMPLVYGLATDDAHGYHAFGVGKVNPGRGWVMVKAPYLSAEAIVRGLETGNFYASTGVVLGNVQWDGKKLELAIEGEAGVSYNTQFIATMRDASLDSKPSVDAEFRPLDVTRIYSDAIGKVVAQSNSLTPSYQVTGQELYIRAKVTSSKAHPNPYREGDVEVAWTQPFPPS